MRGAVSAVRGITRASRLRRPPGARQAVSAASLVVVTALGCGVPADGGRRAQWRGTVMQEPVAKPDLVLTDTEGRRFDLRAETAGAVTLLFFGYTHCPDVCPVQMATLGAAFGELRPELRGRINVVFVSTDPERDTPERLRSWLDGFDASFVGLRGPMDRINQGLADMKLPGVAVMPAAHEDGGEPIIGHPAAVLAFGLDDLARVRYGFGVRRSDWAHDLPLLVGR